MTYDVLLEKVAHNGYTARVLAWPDCAVAAETREKVLALARMTILERLAQAEIVTIEVKPEEIANPWLKFAGMWADDPYMDEFRTEIERYRREIDAEYEHEFEAEIP